MPTLILQTVARLLLPLMLLISVFVLVRGHNATGGGFVGGLLAAAAFALYALAQGTADARRILWVDSRALVGIGLLTALGSGLPALAAGEPFMTGQWIVIGTADFGRLDVGTPLAFDFGVYLAVLGVMLTVLFALSEQ